ncbi:MAG: protein-(glutamine-N5) methyltransferase, release factor-specific [Rhodospirillales bacterium 20-60-12]|nr:MAG: protein-(glutamine-N5) methyltransferase, release factor-specific [Rhodospirillales bacterium 20-60-12]HQT67356.1 peptide chain release factor N(5)-glutamine methyltransferase [Acetobacteraceae bacterium]
MIGLRAALADIAARLAAAGITDARREARILLAAALGIDTTRLQLVDHIDPAGYQAYLQRRAAREPMAFITGRREFWGLEFEVSSATLIPRPDSETLIQAALAECPAPSRILDLGTGTGCLLLALLSERPAAFGVGVDVAPAAAHLAARNAQRLGLGTRACFITGDWAAALSGPFDLIMSNPPYITQADMADLMPEVAGFEPARALDGGPDGLDAYRAILQALPSLLARGAVAVLEIGAGQAPDLADLADFYGFSAMFRADLAGIERAAILRRTEDGEKTFGMNPR